MMVQNVARVTIGLAFSATLWSRCVAAEPPRYAVTDLGTLWPRDINNRGQIVGRGFLWDNGVVTSLGDPEGDAPFIDAVSINNLGQIVGQLRDESSVKAVLYDSGKVTELPFQSVAGINDAGQIAGSNSFADKPLLYSGSTTTLVPPLEADFPRGQAMAINSHGEVVGSLASGAGEHAFVFAKGQTTDLGTLSDLSSVAHSVNDRGDVVGQMMFWDGRHHAFFYGNGGLIDLGTLGGAAAQANDINNAGQIVGFSYSAPGNSLPVDGFLSQDGVMYDLKDLMLVPRETFFDFRPAAINDAGQIVAIGSGPAVATHGFLLTPVPEPAGAAVLLMLGGFASGRVRKR